MFFEIVGTISDRIVFARGHSVRDLKRLRRKFGGKHWKKAKGIAHVKLPNGRVRLAEIHWYEAHGVGKVEVRIKRFLEE